MPTNMNLVRTSNQLEAIRAEVETRIARSRDPEGNLSSELFKLKNPDLDQTLKQYMAERSVECEKLQTEVDDLMESEEHWEKFSALGAKGSQAANRPPLPSNDRRRSLSKELMASDGYAAMESRTAKSLAWDADIGMKALFETTQASGTDMVSVESTRTGEYVPLPRTRVTLLDIIPQLETDQPSVKYDAETKNESAMDVVAQGDVYKESLFQIDEKTIEVGKSGGFIQVSEELLADRPEMQARLDGSLMSQLMRRIQYDIVGHGTLPTGEYRTTPASDTPGAANSHVTGLLELTAPNLVNGTGKNRIEVIEEAAELIYRNGETEADAILMNSQDWVAIKNLQATTGSFILRGAAAPLWEMVPRQIDEWPVILVNALPAGTVMVGDFGNFCAIRDRQAAQVRIMEAQQVIMANAGDKVGTRPSGRLNIYVDVRYAFYVRRELAFAKITNYGASA